MTQLRTYQSDAVSAVFKRWNTSRAALIVMATGTGKTVVFSEIVRQWCSDAGNEGRVLVLAHRRELVEQARNKMAAWNCDADRIDAATVQGIARRLDRTDPDEYGLVVIDECHHAASKSYRRILDHFNNADVLGVTATPERSDGKSIAEVFGMPCYSYTMSDAIRQGYLSPVTVIPTNIKPDLSNVRTVAGDYSDKDLADAIEPWLDSAAAWIKDNAADRRTVVFLPLIKTAEKMAEICEAHGLTAAEVDGQSADRTQVLADFAAGKYQVLCNAMLLTEGWDCPEVDCVLVMRPTKSRALYVQMVGRGTRLAEGKWDCLVPDVLAYGREELVRPWDVLPVEKPAEVVKAERKKAAAKAAKQADREKSAARQLAASKAAKQGRRAAYKKSRAERHPFAASLKEAFMRGWNAA